MSARPRRDGRMRNRSERARIAPELGYYIIVTDAEKTEKHYFEGLRDALPNDLRRKIAIKVYGGVVPEELVSFCVNQRARHPQYAEPWIVIDRDEVSRFDELVAEAEERGIKVAWSNQCFEVWMSMYFGSVIRADDAQGCTSRFADVFRKATGRAYRKNDPDVYRALCDSGDEGKAIERSRAQFAKLAETCKAPSQMVPCSTVYELVGEIRKKTS